MFAYRPPNFNRGEFFKEISNTLSKALKCYDNIILAGDLNIDLLDPSKDTSNHLCDLSAVFDLKNLVKEPTCFMSDKGSLIYIILTNKPRSFHKTQGFVTGISDFHKLVVTVFRSYYKKLPPKNILYRNVKRFEKTAFLPDLDSTLIQLYNNCQEPYNKLTQKFSEVKHAPVKQKVVRVIKPLFMTKDLSKAIMMKSKAKNQYVKWPSRETFLAFKKAKNKCTSINKKAKKEYFQEPTKYDLMTNKEFWKKTKTEDQISIEVDDELLSHEKILTEIFNEHYINIVEKASGTKPSSLGDSANPLLDETTVGKIIDTYRDHPSAIAIKSSVTQNSKFNLPHATTQDINKIVIWHIL